MDVDEEYARSALECFKKYGFKECQKQFPKVTNSKTLTRYRQALQPGTNGYKFKIRQLKSYVQNGLQNNEIPNDLEVIKEIVIKKAEELGIKSKLKCCEEFIRQTIKPKEPPVKRIKLRKLPKTALILVANGSNEYQIATIVHVLKLASIQVALMNVNGSGNVKCYNGLVIVPDTKLTSEVTTGAVILPGGLQGSAAFTLAPQVGSILKQQEQSRKIIAAIGSSTIALSNHGIGVGKKVTCDTNATDQFDANKYTIVNDGVVTDGRLITCSTTKHVTEFAIAIVTAFWGKERAREVAKELLPDNLLKDFFG